MSSVEVCVPRVTLYITTGMLRLNIVDSSNDPKNVRASFFFFFSSFCFSTPPWEGKVFTGERKPISHVGCPKIISKKKNTKICNHLTFCVQTEFRLLFFSQKYTQGRISEVGCVQKCRFHYPSSIMHIFFVFHFSLDRWNRELHPWLGIITWEIFSLFLFVFLVLISNFIPWHTHAHIFCYK